MPFARSVRACFQSGGTRALVMLRSPMTYRGRAGPTLTMDGLETRRGATSKGGAMTEQELKKYPATELYRVRDTIGVPHPYCIGPHHVAVASDHHSGMLTREAIEDAEKRGHFCCICKGKLRYAEHETALLIGVKFKGELKDAPGLRDYLLSIVEMSKADKMAGFAFIQER